MIRIAILTISDSATSGGREDRSGPELVARCDQLGWSVKARETTPDEVSQIASVLKRWSDGFNIDCILTTGGTGVAPRDHTPEATRLVIEREIPGLGELMRSSGLQQTPFAPLSRAVAGVRGRTVIVNLPGSPKGALFSLSAIEHLIPHITQLLAGDTEHTSNGN